MRIVVAARCRNDERHVERFLHGYSFADAIVISDGGSTDKSVQLLKKSSKVMLHHFDDEKEVNGIEFNEDAPHINFVLDKAKELEPDWIIFDDIDDVPNYLLRDYARYLLRSVVIEPQVNAYRMYMWNEDMYFPQMTMRFHEDYSSLWAWRPDKVDIYADGCIDEITKAHVTIMGMSKRYAKLAPPYCLLHYSWSEDTIEQKIKRYEAMGIPFQHPLKSRAFGEPEALPKWARL